MKKSMKENGNMPNEHLHDLMVDELKDILGAEKQLLKGLKKMSAEAENEMLQQAFKEHLQQTEGHIERLKQVFEHLNMKPRSKTCKAMEGLLKEAEEIISDFEDSPAKDAALICAAQKIEHYEIASYGSLATYAELMQHDDVAELLKETLSEEKETDNKLTEIAMNSANVEQTQPA
ncbi:ferritin-like domain-containing protein [Pedobacter sp.]|uniref:ferritin-like domain-containing protein n=1 Tax=Pedobacter sp. TaxID=1411316 RepID=UPI00396C7258